MREFAGPQLKVAPQSNFSLKVEYCALADEIVRDLAQANSASAFCSHESSKTTVLLRLNDCSSMLVVLSAPWLHKGIIE